MSFILIPQHGDDVKINAWNWRPTLMLLLNAHLIDEDLYERMGVNGAGGGVDLQAAERIANFLGEQLEVMKPGQRFRSDLKITAEPPKPSVFAPGTKVEDIDAVELYSATYEWLVMFRDFCRTCGGFKVS